MSRRDYERVERAIRFLQQHREERPALKDIASHVGLSEFHFQRLFQRWAGVSPKRFLQFQALEDAKRLLSDSRSVLDASLDVGMSGPGRLHDLFLRLEAMTPGEFKSPELEISYGVHSTPFGEALFAVTPRGLCGLTFVVGSSTDAEVASLRARWPAARISHRPQRTQPFAAEMIRRVRGLRPKPLSLLLGGSELQLKVWEALLRIPEGAVTRYGELANWIGAPGSARAVGRAVGQNPIAVLIPCHRVIQSTGAFGDYHWGALRKRAILGVEAARGGSKNRVEHT
ncbi:MAG: methylated-DNA--[protein]-cysteine S-methyltransferase [Myxococcaceae bacterium]